METRTIQVVSDVCPVPLVLSVRKFVPEEQDTMKKSWMDGKVKKYAAPIQVPPLLTVSRVVEQIESLDKD
jgi:hypothetical protein